MAIGRQFGREASIYLVGFGAVGAIQFIALPIYSRTLGPELFGYYSLTTAVTTVLAGVMVIGGDVALARFWGDAKTDLDKKALASTWIAFLTLWSVLVAVIACAAAPLVADALRPETDLAALLIVGYLGMVPTQLGRMLAQVMRNTFRPGLYSLTLVVNAALNVALGLLFGMVLGLDVYGILLGILVGESIGSLIRLPLVRQYLGWSFDWTVLRPMLRFGIPLVPATLATWAFKGADRLMLGASVSLDALGHYGLAVSLIAPFTLVTAALGQAWIPQVVEMNSEDRVVAGRSTSRAIGYALGSFGAVAMATGALAPSIVEVVGGPAYAESAKPLPLLALGAVFASTALFTATGLTLAKQTTVILLVTIVAGAVALGLLLMLVPRSGLVGAAAAVAAGYFCVALLTLYFAKRVFPITVNGGRLGGMVLVLIAQTAACTYRLDAVAVAAATLVGAGILAYLARPEGVRLAPERAG